MEISKKKLVSINYIKTARFIFFDFDGVIKDSVKIKSDAFEKLFLPFGKDTANKVKVHHEDNAGMSRYDKLPIYLKLANQKPNVSLIDEYAEKFSSIVKQEVIDSKWVDGILNYLENNNKKQKFFIITATPQKEIEDILFQLNIINYFQEIIGSPTSKINGLKNLLDKYRVASKDAIMIGDSYNDYDAAIKNQVNFVLRKTKFNKRLQISLTCVKINNFMEIKYGKA
jgi:phosphoglycolate phosphatase-like HAD superfamily hydrolase